MQSKWRVACVRIPRFPIGAVWQHEIARGRKSLPPTGVKQAPDQPTPTPTPTPTPDAKVNRNGTAAPSPASGDSAKRIPGATNSFWESRRSSDERAIDEARGQSHDPHWDELPIVLSDRLHVRAVTAAGAKARIRAGVTVTEATSRCAELQVVPWDQVVVDDEIRRATVAFLGASPQVTPVAGAPGLWWIGATGLETLGGEVALGKALLAIARRWHPGARVAIADSCVAARAATWETRPQAPGPRPQALSPVTIVPPGTDAAYLATAPVGIIPMDDAMAEALEALGIRTAGALAALPSDDVEQRWGNTGLTAWRLAHGEDRRRPGLATTEYPRTVSADLVPGVETTEPILFLVRAALDRLLVALVADGRAAATLAITLTLDDARGAVPDAQAHTITREVRLAHPMARLVPLFERCRALLDRWALPAPVCGVTVAIVATAPLVGEQGDLLDPSWHDPAAADAAFARLRAELGADAIVVPVVADEHRPEKAGVWLSLGEPDGPQRPGPIPKAPGPRPQAPGPVPSCTRQLETPEPVDVECADGQPRVLWWRGRRMRLEHPTGPERLAGDWWKDRYIRDYWRCEDPDGEGTLMLYHDYSQACLSSGSAWFVQGWYD